MMNFLPDNTRETNGNFIIFNAIIYQTSYNRYQANETIVL